MRKRNKFFYFLYGLVVFFIGFLYVGEQVYVRISRRKINKLGQEIKEKEQEAGYLVIRLNTLKGPDYIGKYAREQLRMVLPSAQNIILMSDDD